MKRTGLLLLIVMASVFGLSFLAWGQCPEEPLDQGQCDTLDVICFDCLQPDTGIHFVRFPLLVTNDLVDPYIDSLSGFVVPLTWTKSNPSAYCSLSNYWNNTSFTGTNFTRSIFRHIIVGNDTLYHNRMLDLYNEGNQGEWDTKILSLSTNPPFGGVSLLATGPDDQRWWQGHRVLLATLTFKLQDTMHVCLDSTFWPPSGRISFLRSDGQVYIPRHNLPYCFWIGPPQIRVVSPNGGETWVVGDAHNIAWLSENFDGANVKIEYSTNSGANWLPVVNSTPNTGSYPWLIPSTPSPNCLVRVSDAADGIPFDVSDNVFSITLTPYFSIDAVPDTQWVKQGGNTSYQLTLTSYYGFNSPCSLTISGVPPQASHEFNPPVVTPTGTSTLSLTTDSLTPLGSYVLTVIATQKAKLAADTVKVLLYVTSSLNHKPKITVPTPQTVYGGLQLAFAVVATDADTVDTLTLTKTGVGDFPCYPRVSPVVCYFQWSTVPADTLNSPYNVMFTVSDGRDSTDTAVVQIRVLPYHVLPSGRPGDVTGDNLVDAPDVVFLVNYLFLGGPPPNPPAAGDVTGDCFIGLSDLIWLINYLYRSGPPPQIRCLPGDFNYDGFVNMSDPAYFINYMAHGGPTFTSMKSTDVNADCFVNAVDLIYEIKYLLRGGDAPQPGCVEPKFGAPKAEPAGIAEVTFLSSRYDQGSRINEMPISARFDNPVAGAELVISFDPDVVSLLPPIRTSRTENLGLFYNLQRGKLTVGLVDISGVSFIQPGDGPILNLRFVPRNAKLTGANTIQVEKATFVDMKAEELLEKLVK
ncbi:MAG: dockerin type I domain-containing protein [Candidatus Zixiibacteriota bacterium]